MKEAKTADQVSGCLTETLKQIAETIKSVIESIFGKEATVKTLDKGIRQRKKRVYIAGPMSGKKDFNRAAFFRAAADIKNAQRNWMPVHAAWQEDGELYAEYMRQALQLLLSCDAILLLPGWRNSKGAMFEYKTAKACGMEIMEMME